MELKQIKELMPSSLQTLSQVRSEYSNEVSVYTGALTDRCLVNSVAIIKKSFPSLPIGFFDVFIDRIKANGFSDQRLIDAVNHVIDNCPYLTPSIAQFISFDKKYKIVTYEQMIKKAEEFGPEIWKSYKKLMLPDRSKPVWVHIDEAKKYNL